mgnify:FL=1
MANAFTKPLNDAIITVDKNGRKSIKYIGKNATIVVNPDTGVVVTVWKTGKSTVKKYGDKK